MRNENLMACIHVKNLPQYIDEGFMVARQDSGEVWYYGTYDTEEQAKEVAIEIGNGLYFEIR